MNSCLFRRSSIFALLYYLLSVHLCAAGEFVTKLRQLGFSLIPAPQIVELEGSLCVLDSNWGVKPDSGVSEVSVRTLQMKVQEFYGLKLPDNGRRLINLRLNPGCIEETDDPALNEQGYRLRIGAQDILLEGSGQSGLFYGIQSLLQLLRRDANGNLVLPVGEIRDWPDVQLRFIHWDTKHHQKRFETLFRLLDWAAFFKVNAIGFEMEDKYEYPRNPVIGAPGAYSKEQMHQLTKYALERHIQLVPVIQSPAHMAYVLKHDQFKHLRADPESNYQACLCDEEAIQLILEMYQDMIDATPGVRYFHVSTDEVYFAGICEKCQKPFNDKNRSQAWVDFVNRVHPWLEERGRTMIAWVEWPLLAEDIIQLPGSLIDGVMGYDAEFLQMEKRVGIRQLAYSSVQGMEDLFPNYFPTTYRGRKTEGRLRGIFGTIARGRELGADPIGSFAAAWDDSGLHEETFWLGWATVTQYAWTHLVPTVEQSVADFMVQYYGHPASEMVHIYKLLLDGARFYESSWDRVISKERVRAYDDRERKFDTTHRRFDKSLTIPPLPDSVSLSIEPIFSLKYRELLERVEEQERNNDLLCGLVQGAFGEVERNRYALEVFLSIAYFQRHFIETLKALESAEKSLIEASRKAGSNDHRGAVASLKRSSSSVSSLLKYRDWMWAGLKEVWEKSRYPKGRSFGERDYLHVMDDLKDHPADRRPGLEYLLAPFERLNLEGWHSDLLQIVEEYEGRHGLNNR